MARGFNYTKLTQQDRMRQNGWERFEPEKKKKIKKTKLNKKPLPPLVLVWDPGEAEGRGGRRGARVANAVILL